MLIDGQWLLKHTTSLWDDKDSIKRGHPYRPIMFSERHCHTHRTYNGGIKMLGNGTKKGEDNFFFFFLGGGRFSKRYQLVLNSSCSFAMYSVDNYDLRNPLVQIFTKQLWDTITGSESLHHRPYRSTNFKTQLGLHSTHWNKYNRQYYQLGFC